MPTQCSRDLFGYEVVEGRQVVAAFDGGEVTSDAGALLLGATDRAIGRAAGGRVVREGARAAAIHVARELVEEDDQRERAVGGVEPGVDATAGALLDAAREPVADLVVELGRAREPHLADAVFEPEREHVGRQR